MLRSNKAGFSRRLYFQVKDTCHAIVHTFLDIPFALSCYTFEEEALSAERWNVGGEVGGRRNETV